VDHRIVLLLLIWIYIVPRRLEDLGAMLLEVNRVGRTIGSRQTRSLGLLCDISNERRRDERNVRRESSCESVHIVSPHVICLSLIALCLVINMAIWLWLYNS
jgi:hypothetical protein